MVNYNEIESEHGHVDIDAIKAMVSNNESYFETLSIDEIVEQYDETYAGQYDSPAEFTEELLHDTSFFDGIENDDVIHYFDYQQYWDSMLRHDFFEIDGYYFRNY